MFKIPTSWLNQKRHLIRVAKKIIIFTFILIFYLIFILKYETLVTPGNEQYMHHWTMYECSQDYEDYYVPSNPDSSPGPCFKSSSSSAVFSSKWPTIRVFCPKISLVWADGGNLV